MLLLLILLFVIVLFLCYLLFAPFYLFIDSSKNEYGLRFHKILKVLFYLENNALKLDLIILGWRKQLDFGNKKIQVIEPSKKKEKKQRKTIPAKKVFAIIKSFKVTQFYLNLSFKNMAINGILYPFFALLRLKTKRNIQINFFNKNEIIIEVENTFYRIFKAYINS